MILSADEFRFLRRSSSPEEQARASQEEASLAVWLDVVTRFPDLREWVVLNKTVPIEILELLSDDSNASVRCVVADKRKLTPALRSKLAIDPEPSVRARIACNAKCEDEILKTLATDAEPIVKNAAIKRLAARAREA